MNGRFQELRFGQGGHQQHPHRRKHEPFFQASSQRHAVLTGFRSRLAVHDTARESERYERIDMPDGTHVVASRTDWGLGTFELWGDHVAGGTGIQIVKADREEHLLFGRANI